MKFLFYFNDCSDKLISSSDKNSFWKSAFLVNEFYKIMFAFVLYALTFCVFVTTISAHHWDYKAHNEADSKSRKSKHKLKPVVRFFHSYSLHQILKGPAKKKL